jgi:7-carboxy-7-deazaguanine synthase
MAAPEILQRVDALSGGRPVLVTISGGNPALQPLGGLIARGKAGGHSFAVETQGSVAPQWFAALDWLIVSPKPPSASVATDWSSVESCINAAGRQPRCALKIVIFDDRDYDFARTAARRFPSLPMYLQVGNPAPLIAIDGGGSERADVDELMRRFRWLVGKVADDRWFEVTVLPQLHVLAWGNRRGV